MLCILPALQEAAEGYTQLELIRQNKDEKMYIEKFYSNNGRYQYDKISINEPKLGK